MKTTYVYRDGKLIPKPEAARLYGVTVMRDIQSFISPIDGTEITSRSHLREHERAHGVRQIGNDVKPPRTDDA